MNFIEVVEDWKSNDEWRYADKEAAWKFFFAAGKESSQAVISAQCVKMSQYESIIFELRKQLAKAEQRVAEYNELIYAVQTKNPDETRHQTALRYIRNAENRPSNTAVNGASS